MHRTCGTGCLTPSLAALAAQVALDEVDSAGRGANDMMELVTAMDASPRTKALLLDDFMQGVPQAHTPCAYLPSVHC